MKPEWGIRNPKPGMVSSPARHRPWVCTENREIGNGRRPIFQPRPGTRTQKQESRNLRLETFRLSTGFCNEKQEITGTSEFCRAGFGICAPELETPVWNLRTEFSPQFNEIAISHTRLAGWPFFAPGNENSETRPCTRPTPRPARARCKDAPTPPTPNLHQTLSARAATAAQLAAWAVGPTAGAARQPRSSPRKAGVQPGLHVWAYDVPRAACASSGAPKRWLAADAATFVSIYMELRPGTPTRRLPAGATCTSTWTVAALAQCRVEYCLPRR